MAYTVGANDNLLSAFVNLIAAGVATADAKAFVLTMVPTDFQTDVGTNLDDVTTDCEDLATQEVGDRVPADGWNYLSSSPMQTYEVLP